MKTRPQQQHGFAAIAAIFLVVVLAALGGFMLTFSNTQQLNSAQDMQGTRAYWAARGGLEWAFAQIKANPSACPSSPPTSINTGADFSLSISCTQVGPYVEGDPASPRYIFYVSAVASSGTAGSLGYVERSVFASIEL
jgi:MSHA biogenesis protein MshP